MVATSTEPPAAPSVGSRASTLSAVRVSAWFGTNKVLEQVSLTMPAAAVTALIGPSGCGKSTFLRILNRLHESVPSAKMAGEVLLNGEDIYAPDRSHHRDAPPNRHGVPEAEPVPGDVDRRQRHLWSSFLGRPPPSAGSRRPRRGVPDPRRTVERGEGPAHGRRWRALRGTAAAVVHRSLARRRSRRAAHGRAVLGSRPDVDAVHRGDDRASWRPTSRS